MITDGPIVARLSHGSVYRFGKKEASGERTVTVDGAKRDFSRCRIVVLETGKHMELFPTDCSGYTYKDGETFYASYVESITAA